MDAGNNPPIAGVGFVAANALTAAGEKRSAQETIQVVGGEQQPQKVNMDHEAKKTAMLKSQLGMFQSNAVVSLKKSVKKEPPTPVTLEHGIADNKRRKSVAQLGLDMVVEEEEESNVPIISVAAVSPPAFMANSHRPSYGGRSVSPHAAAFEDDDLASSDDEDEEEEDRERATGGESSGLLGKGSPVRKVSLRIVSIKALLEPVRSTPHSALRTNVTNRTEPPNNHMQPVIHPHATDH
jgi:hypothetical protein